jgi:hypothetical protein
MTKNETNNQEVELTVEEAEAVIAPGLTTINHNETVEVELNVEEAEVIITPGMRLNHNEALMVEA